MSRLDEIEARLKAATPGEWKASGSHRSAGVWMGNVRCKIATVVAPHLPPVFSREGSLANAQFIANAPADIAALLEVARAAEPLTRNLTKRDERLLALNCDEDICLVKDITVGEMRRLRAALKKLEGEGS